MKIENKLTKAVLGAITDYLTKNTNCHVILEYSIFENQITSSKIFTVPHSDEYFQAKKYDEAGFKCWSKTSRKNTRICYIIFETERLNQALGSLMHDIQNIELDVNRRVYG